jgi:hypothetical protein
MMIVFAYSVLAPAVKKPTRNGRLSRVCGLLFFLPKVRLLRKQFIQQTNDYGKPAVANAMIGSEAR